MAEPVFERFDPPIAVTIHHARSGASMEAQVHGWDRRAHRLDVSVSLCGGYWFSAATGAGRGAGQDWYIAMEDIRLIRRDPDFAPAYKPKRKAGTRKANSESNDPRNLELFR